MPILFKIVFFKRIIIFLVFIKINNIMNWLAIFVCVFIKCNLMGENEVICVSFLQSNLDMF